MSGLKAYYTDKLYTYNGNVGHIVKFFQGGEWCSFKYSYLHNCYSDVITSNLKEYTPNGK